MILCLGFSLASGKCLSCHGWRNPSFPSVCPQQRLSHPLPVSVTRWPKPATKAALSLPLMTVSGPRLSAGGNLPGPRRPSSITLPSSQAFLPCFLPSSQAFSLPNLPAVKTALKLGCTFTSPLTRTCPANPACPLSRLVYSS